MKFTEVQPDTYVPEKGQLILVAEDDLVNRTLLQKTLSRHDFDVLVAEDGDEALKLAREYVPAAILLDVMMPKRTGYEVCQELKEDKRFNNTPIIFLTSKTDTDDKIHGLTLGAVDYLNKPINPRELITRINNQLRIRDNHIKILRLSKILLQTNDKLEEKQKKLERDLQAAAAIQMSLVPQKEPQIKNLKFAWQFVPCSFVGGDIFNFVKLDEEHLGIYVIDVSGHGIPSAMVTVSISQNLSFGDILKHSIEDAPYYSIMSPSIVLEQLNREYPMERFGMHFTMSYFILNFRTGKLTYSSAGHPYPFILRESGDIVELKKGGTIIGLDKDSSYSEETSELQDGDRLFLFTDGVPESTSESGEYYEYARLYDRLQSTVKEPLPQSVEQLFEDLGAFTDHKPPTDDLTLVGIEFTTDEID